METPKINIPFFITIDKACKRTNLELFSIPYSQKQIEILYYLYLNSSMRGIGKQVHKDKMVFDVAQVWKTIIQHILAILKSFSKFQFHVD